MVGLSETQRIEILIIIGYGEGSRTQAQPKIFNNKYPDYYNT